MPYFVYILECSDKTLYIGSTNDLEKRLYSHNFSKSGAHYTKLRRPVALKYFESFPTKSKALKREHKLKKLTRAEKLRMLYNCVV
jgi:putative endonuclease